MKKQKIADITSAVDHETLRVPHHHLHKRRAHQCRCKTRTQKTLRCSKVIFDKGSVEAARPPPPPPSLSTSVLRIADIDSKQTTNDTVSSTVSLKKSKPSARSKTRGALLAGLRSELAKAVQEMDDAGGPQCFHCRITKAHGYKSPESGISIPQEEAKRSRLERVTQKSSRRLVQRGSCWRGCGMESSSRSKWMMLRPERVAGSKPLPKDSQSCPNRLQQY